MRTFTRYGARTPTRTIWADTPSRVWSAWTSRVTDEDGSDALTAALLDPLLQLRHQWRPLLRVLLLADYTFGSQRLEVAQPVRWCLVSALAGGDQGTRDGACDRGEERDADDHQASRGEFPLEGDREDVAVSHCRERNDAPPEGICGMSEGFVLPVSAR